MKLGQDVCLNEILHKFTIGSKTMSLGKILEKPNVCCRGLIFGSILMKLYQNICLDQCSGEVKKS